MQTKFSLLIFHVLFLIFLQQGLQKGLQKSFADSQAMSGNLDSVYVDAQAYVGAQACEGCHTEEYKQWQKSDHSKAMQVATINNVLGDFSNVSVNFHGIKSRFYQQQSKFLVDTMDSTEKTNTFEIKYTFGFYPLQQYLVEMPNGHVQALNIAWDSRNKNDGGQRWFHLQPDENITPEHPFFWTGHFQNWNSRCADCHSTNFKKNYDPQTHRYQSTWSEINVACEACHGPAAEHVALAETDALSNGHSGFSRSKQNPLLWQFKSGASTASPTGSKVTDDIDTCGRCHSLRSRIAETGFRENKAGENRAAAFHDGYMLQLLAEGSYFDDGQIREEAFVFGSFLQSKMHAKGVSCVNCHNPHSGKLLIEGNGLCGQCHDSKVFARAEHHHHVDDSSGAACVNCHMPTKTYMQVDARRDHSFTIPRPDLSAALSVPNACVSCHGDEADKDNQWASKVLSNWGVISKPGHWGIVNHRAKASDVLVTRALASAVDDKSNPEIIRASLLAQFGTISSRVSAEVARKALQDSSPLVRRAAVNSLENMPSEFRWQLLSPHLNDSHRSVRIEVARVLADVLSQLPETLRGDLQDGIQEYRQALLVTVDSPATQLNIANLEMRMGNVQAAGMAYQKALQIEPSYVPALINLADYYRRTAREAEVEPLLKKALAVGPDSGAAHHSYGLFLIRNKDYTQALPHLKRALEQVDAQPRFAYVYAIALENKNQIEKAINLLIDTNKRWPNQYDLLMLLIKFLEKSGDTLSVYKHLSTLTAIAPADPPVKALVQKYSH